MVAGFRRDNGSGQDISERGGGVGPQLICLILVLTSSSIKRFRPILVIMWRNYERGLRTIFA